VTRTAAKRGPEAPQQPLGGRCAVPGGVNGGVVRCPVPEAGMHDPKPPPAEDANGLRVAFASVSDTSVEVSGPWIVMSAVVGDGVECHRLITCASADGLRLGFGDLARVLAGRGCRDRPGEAARPARPVRPAARSGALEGVEIVPSARTNA
jgi:hypothetical protein